MKNPDVTEKTEDARHVRSSTKKKVRSRKLAFAFTVVGFTVYIKQPVNLRLQSVKPCETKAL